MSPGRAARPGPLGGVALDGPFGHDAGVTVFERLVERFDPEACEVPTGEAVVRLRQRGGRDHDVHIDATGARLATAGAAQCTPQAVLTADAATWRSLAADITGGMTAFREGRLEVRGNLHVGVGFLAATASTPVDRRLHFRQVRTSEGTVSALIAGRGEPVVLAHGLGATKASFLPTVSALADRYRCIAIDLPGFGDSDKPVFAAYDAPFFSRWLVALMDALGIERAHVVGHSLGGRAAIELGLRSPERVRRLVLMTPSLAWRRNREWAALLRLVRPELGLLPIAPRQLVERVLERLLPEAGHGWAAAGRDEFMRAYLTPSGRAAFFAAARQVYLEEPEGPEGFWSRLAGLTPPALFIWGRKDRLVPASFRRHVAEVLPAAGHIELDSGHVPQLQAPHEVHVAIREFLGRRARARVTARQR